MEGQVGEKGQVIAGLWGSSVGGLSLGWGGRQLVRGGWGKAGVGAVVRLAASCLTRNPQML